MLGKITPSCAVGERVWADSLSRDLRSVLTQAASYRGHTAGKKKSIHVDTCGIPGQYCQERAGGEMEVFKKRTVTKSSKWVNPLNSFWLGERGSTGRCRGEI